MALPETRRVSGTALLRSAREELVRYRGVLEAAGKQVAILRFAAAEDDPPVRRFRMEAARVSAAQKVKAFSWLGFNADLRVLPPTMPVAEFAGLIDALGDDPRVAAVIVQFPPPPRLAPLVQRLARAKDIDGLLEDRSPQPACATADGIARVVTAFAADSPDIAVVGSAASSAGGSSACWPPRGCPRGHWTWAMTCAPYGRPTLSWPPPASRTCLPPSTSALTTASSSTRASCPAPTAGLPATCTPTRPASRSTSPLCPEE